MEIPLLGQGNGVGKPGNDGVLRRQEERRPARKKNPRETENASSAADCFVKSKLKIYFFVHKIFALYFTHISSSWDSFTSIIMRSFVLSSFTYSFAVPEENNSAIVLL